MKLNCHKYECRLNNNNKIFYMAKCINRVLLKKFDIITFLSEVNIPIK